MGRPKALLPIGSTTFLGKILDDHRTLGTGRIVLVLGRDAGSVMKDVSDGGIDTIVNPDPGRGQLSSLVTALEALRDDAPAAVIVHPVDHPMVRGETLTFIRDAALLHPGRIIIPTCRSRRGHPVAFPSELFGELEQAPPGEGARSVVRSRPAAVVELRTGDEGVLANIDTPEAYERLRRDLQGAA